MYEVECKSKNFYQHEFLDKKWTFDPLCLCLSMNCERNHEFLYEMCRKSLKSIISSKCHYSQDFYTSGRS